MSRARDNADLGDSYGVLGSGVTGGSGLTALGTVASGTLATGVHGKYVVEDYDDFYHNSQLESTDTSQAAINISGSSYVTVTTGTSTSDLLEFIMNYGTCFRAPDSGGSAVYMGFGLQRDSATDFSSSPTTMYASGEHSWGTGGDIQSFAPVCLTQIKSVTDWGLSASTTYYVRMTGQTHSPAGTFRWGQASITNQTSADGIRLFYKKWRLLS